MLDTGFYAETAIDTLIFLRSPRATEGMHIFFSYAYVFAYVTVFDLPARGQPHSVFGVCACLARVCLLLALANSLPQRASGSL